MQRGSVDDQYAINAAKTEIREGYNTADIDRILAAYQDGFEDYSDGFPGLGADESKTAFRERLTRLFATYDVHFTPVTVFIDIFGDTAIAAGAHQLDLRSKADGNAHSLRHRFLELWQKHAGGTWAIRYVLSNADHPPLLLPDMLQRLSADGLHMEPRSGT